MDKCLWFGIITLTVMCQVKLTLMKKKHSLYVSLFSQLTSGCWVTLCQQYVQ